MKLVDNILYLEFSEMAECGVSENTLLQAKSRKSKSWSFIDDPDDQRKVLIEYEKVANSYKKLIKKQFGKNDEKWTPYVHVARQPILKMVIIDDKAEQFYLDYRFDGVKTLSTGEGSHVEKYTKAASWLNMLKVANDDKKALKKLLGLSIDQFYVHVMALLKTEEIDLPASYRKLLDKQKLYNEEGYVSLISKKFGNKSAAKVKDLAEDVLLTMIENGNQYDDNFICRQYNVWAKKNGFKIIDSSTVGVHRRKKEFLIIGEREGKAALNKKFLKQVKGSRPSFPLALIESDDNYIDLQYIDVQTGNKYTRYIAIVVVDSFNDYVLGYAYSTKLSNELIKAAYVNAMYNIRRLTGQWHLPHEIKTDNWSISTLKPYYKSIAHFEESATGSKNRGYIEQFFGSSLWKNSLKIGANNYTGNNMTAINRGVNVDTVNSNISKRPVLGNQSEYQIEQFFHRLRNMPDSNGIAREVQWFEAWEKLSDDKKRPISDEQYLLKFGINHNYNNDGIRITNRGVEPQINGKKYSYDLVQYNLEHIGKQVSVLYDPYDMSRVLVTDFDKVRILGIEASLPGRAFVDSNIDSKIYVNLVLLQKKNDSKMIGQKSDDRKKNLKTINIDDPEALLQSGVMVKEIKQAAEQKLLINKSNNENSLYDKY